jgi:HD-GYP domain-containing protein (c-di-GMP phosphodiesterase class II)
MIDFFASQAETPEPDLASLREMRPDQLRIGMHIVLNCSWFKHPFPLKSFRLDSHDQIKTILGLNLQSVTVDLKKSDPTAILGIDDPFSAEAPARTDSSASISYSGREHPSQAPLIDERESPGTPRCPQSPSPPSTEQYGCVLKQVKLTFQQAIRDSSLMMQQICSGSKEGLKAAEQMVHSLSQLLQEDHNSSAIISMLNTEEVDDTSALHALNVCTLSMMVGRQFQLPTDQIKALGVGGLFHDMGESRIPAVVLQHRGQLTADQQRQIEEHPRRGAKIASRIPGFPPEALEIVWEHHERLDGSGYPLKLKTERISPLSQIVMAVDEYDDLINPRRPVPALSPTKALSELYVKRRGLLSHDVIVALVQTLSVYPPGSIVQLSDGEVGLVLSTNFTQRMRPLVLVHDPTVSRETPRIVNLMENPTISIDQLVERHDIRPEVADYLSLKNWIGYFIHAAAQTVQEQAASRRPPPEPSGIPTAPYHEQDIRTAKNGFHAA